MKKTLAEQTETIESQDGAIVIHKTIVEARPAVLPIDVLVKQGHERAGLENLVRDGKVRSVRIGRKVCIVVDDLIALAEKREARPSTKKAPDPEVYDLTKAISARGGR